MNTIRALEEAALVAHGSGVPWRTFHRQHNIEINSVEPFDPHRHHELLVKLMALVVSGDTEGMEPAGEDSEPWLVDDTDKPADVGTRARLLADAIPGRPASRRSNN